jgi:phosphate transport system permease protein
VARRSPQGGSAGSASVSRRILADRVASVLLGGSALFLVLLLGAVYAFVGSKSFDIFRVVSPAHFFFADAWRPYADQADFGAAGVIVGSLVVVGIAIVLATPLSLGAALFLEQTDRQLGERLLRPVLEVFVGIPSVVYGWLGLTTLVPVIRDVRGGGTGQSILAAAVVLTIMILPTVTTLSADAIRNVPDTLAEASYALGATRWQTIWRAILPSARAGITTGVVLGVARALGEALAVAMVIGNIPRLPRGLLEPASTMTTVISADLASRALNPMLNNALFTLGLLLLLLSLAAIMVIRYVSRGFEAR